MALPSNRPSSPSIMAGRTSPNSRNSEIGNPVRRSFSGNPFSKPSLVANPRSLNPVIPANSPCDHPRRSSVSREILFTSRDSDEKENGKDQSPKAVRVRSPTVGKLTKHFMSPTISAASKIAVSPKKKILGDRNEPVRSSLSYSGMKSSSLNSVNPIPDASTALESDTSPQIASISNPKSSKTVRFGGFEVISGLYDDSESTYRYDLNPEVVTMAVETDVKSEIAPISKSAIAAAPSKSSETMKFGGFEVSSDSYDDSESVYTCDMNPEIVTMAIEADRQPEIIPISSSDIAAAPLKASKTVRFADFEVTSVSNNELESPATEEVDCVNLHPSFKISPVASSMVAPLDADPLIPPYDPKTNYLSPRPQFLHYRPNRRINRYEPDGRLEELFSSAYVFESEFTEETDSEDPQKESDEASSNESQMDEEEGEETEEESGEETEEEEEINVSKQIPAEVQKSSKPHFSRIFKIGSLLLILFIACFSISVVNVHDSNVFRRPSLLTMEDPAEIFEYAKTNFHVLVGKLEVWHANSISFVSDVVFNLRGAQPLIYLNQSELFYEGVNMDEHCLVMAVASMKEREIDPVEEPTEGGGQIEKGEEQEQESLQEIEDMKQREIGIEAVERESQNEEKHEEELLQEIEDMKQREIGIEAVERESQNEEKHEEELFQEIEYMKEREVEIGPIQRESQNEEVEKESSQEIEAKINDSEDSEEEKDEVSEESLQEIIEETSANLAFDELTEEEYVHEKSEENYGVSSSPSSKIHDQIEQEAATEETDEEQHNSMQIQQSNTEFQYQSPPATPPFDEPQSDVEEENGGKIDLIGTATNHRISRDFTQNTGIITYAIVLGLSVIIPAGLIYARKSSPKPSSIAAAIAEEQEEKPLLREKKVNQTLIYARKSSSKPSSIAAAIAEEQEEKPLLREKKVNQSPVEEEEEEAMEDDDRDDVAGEFSSSGTSSFQYSSMRERETAAGKKSSEVQSQSHGRKMRKNSRRESMASSSLDEHSSSTLSASPSYGSFTTYEKIPIKHRNGDEEIVTPVRRSSRIRNQHNNS